ncbi:MAG TPA: NAD(P)/FAD-dependent oxidoreductase [Ramlibacter sp.]|nr:NAD(P)/FAD-dependent oxidoreductase [Ramlibacter sp.]
MTTPPPSQPETDAFFDVIVVGAGLSGIAAGHYLQTLCPGFSYVILESRQAIGGTWDLFRFPGVRSDSDMFTLGYSFRPWRSDASFPPGSAIRDYVTEAAREEGIDRQIRFGHRVTAADWDPAQARWTVSVAIDPGAPARLACRFLFFCSGYYDYEQGHDPDWPGRQTFGGRIVHPQHWPADLDYANRQVVIIGSGATAVTLVPAMAATAAGVTMLQRSPSYIIALPRHDAIGAALRRRLPQALAHGLVRWKNILLTTAFYQYSRRWPEHARGLMLRAARRRLPGFDVQRHLSPSYQPWDQRLCIAPDADMFKALHSGKAAIVTDNIERFTPRGLRLASGEELPADIIVTATGLKLKVLGGVRISIDGQPVDVSKALVYRGVMYSGVPNMAVASGYTNASWTLKCELAARFVCRLLTHMRSRGLDACVAQPDGQATGPTQPFLNLTSGYVQRSAAALPRQGTRRPWRMYQNYLLDLLSLKLSPLRDRTLRFSRRGEPSGLH